MSEKWSRVASTPKALSSPASKPPTGPGWVHEIKHDGYRLMVRRDGDAVKMFTRRGHDWTDLYPVIAQAAAKLRARSFTLDGEAVVCGPDGIAIFDALHATEQSPRRGSKAARRLVQAPAAIATPFLPCES